MGGFERGVNIKRSCSKSRRGQLGEPFKRHLTQNNGKKQLTYICKVGLQALQLHYPYFTNKQPSLPPSSPSNYPSLLKQNECDCCTQEKWLKNFKLHHHARAWVFRTLCLLRLCTLLHVLSGISDFKLRSHLWHSIRARMSILTPRGDGVHDIIKSSTWALGSWQRQCWRMVGRWGVVMLHNESFAVNWLLYRSIYLMGQCILVNCTMTSTITWN